MVSTRPHAYSQQTYVLVCSADVCMRMVSTRLHAYSQQTYVCWYARQTYAEQTYVLV